jgi:hypothetical protein
LGGSPRGRAPRGRLAPVRHARAPRPGSPLGLDIGPILGPGAETQLL